MSAGAQVVQQVAATVVGDHLYFAGVSLAVAVDVVEYLPAHKGPFAGVDRAILIQVVPQLPRHAAQVTQLVV